MSVNDLRQRLLDSCVGHPAAGIPWPHRLLHEASDELGRLDAENARLRRALTFYADGKHYAGLDEWDTVSGEGHNWLFPVHREDDQAQVEDGWVARATLAGEEIDWSEADG
jgi:hypothetical protein